jgi:hypothetical protein
MKLHSVEQVPLPTKEEAEKIVEPVREALRQALSKAIEDWPKYYEKVRHILGSRSQSSIIHDHIVHHAKSFLTTIPGVKSFRQRGIFTVAIKESADVRFKKLDGKLRSSNVSTKQNNRYSLQLRLDGFPDLPRLTAGYVLDDLRMALSRAVVTLQVGRTVRYAISLSGDSGQQVMAFPSPAIPPAEPSRRVRAKKAPQKIVGKE